MRTEAITDRRGFLIGAAGVLGGAALAGCQTAGSSPSCGSMCNFAAKPMKKVRIGFVGIGERGTWAVHRIAVLPGVEVAALCDLRPACVDESKAWLKEKKLPGALHEYKGKEDSWKGLCDDPEVDVVYICTPALLHAEMEIYALKAGKHVMVEVPGAQTVDQAWEIVEASEKARRHCMMLENCIYGENELFAWNLAHRGILGTLTHAEGGYIHNLVWRSIESDFRNRALFGGGKTVHRYGNTYPTHPLGPICTYMDINRGDCMQSIVSLSSLAAAHREQAAAVYKPDDWQNRTAWLTGDMNTSIIRTAKGRTIMLQYDTATPRPYSRINLIQGTKGCLYDYPLRVSLAKRPGGDNNDHVHHTDWLDEKALAELKKEHMHKLYQTAGDIAKKVGGHGGMDFMMDLRWVYCLQQGLPLDMDVYDLASWSAVVPCSAESDRHGGMPVDLPDFTRGGWRTARPLEIGTVDLDKMGYRREQAAKDDKQMNV